MSMVSQQYYIQTGDVVKKGTIYIFPKGSDASIPDESVMTDYYYRLYDLKNYFLVKNIFIGHDLNLAINQSNTSDSINVKLIQPIYELYDDMRNLNFDGFIEFSNYATNNGALRNHIIFIDKSSISYSYNDARYFNRKIPEFNKPNTTELHGLNMIMSMQNKKTVSKNNFLFALSVIDNVATLEVFIISEIVSWIKQIELSEITKDGNLVDPSANTVNFFDCIAVFAINGHKYVDGNRIETFYFYKMEQSNVTLFLKIVTTEPNNEFTMARNIKIRPNILYIIYEHFKYFNVMDIQPEFNTFHKRYALDVYNVQGGTTYISGS
mmetsp:Transcript_15305/g.17768  ORF Transcript_15305/g.17768 Transcript_15305/m.17768 type:complete len:323 (-) Transcript_15305:154-1122(-)